MNIPPPLPYASADPTGRDAEQLRTLAVLHYVWGGVTIAFSSVFIVHVVIGLMMVNGSFPGPTATGPGRAPVGPPFPTSMGYLFAGLGSCAVACGWALGILTIVSGRRMGRRRSRLFGIVMAGLNCMSFPLGTALGVFTITVLSRDSVKAMYAAADPPG
jgi:hypothetical protein